MALKDITLLNALMVISVVTAIWSYVENLYTIFTFWDWERLFFTKLFHLAFLGYAAIYFFLDKEEIFDEYLMQFCRPDQVRDSFLFVFLSQILVEEV